MKKTFSMHKQGILFGTAILTLAGILTRILGFVYKIYLSTVMSEEQLGLYQLIFPVYGLCFTIFASGLQTAISQLTAHQKTQKKNILKTGMFLSVLAACILSLLLWQNAGWVAARFLREASCEVPLRILSVVFPFCGLTACINGYYYGLKKTACPSLAQLLEQAVRILSVYLLASCLVSQTSQAAVTCETAVIGIVFGELASNALCLLFLCFEKKTPKNSMQPANPASPKKRISPFLPTLLSLAIPLTATRLIVNLLHSLESILIPAMLKQYGLSSEQALSIYGVLTGMSMSFIMFPSAVTSAFSLLLLPMISEAQAAGNQEKIQNAASAAIKYSLYIGLFATCTFWLFGKDIGLLFFHNQQAGSYLTTLAFLCPFLYLSGTLGSIINGLGKTYLTFVNTVLSLAIRILFILFLTPSMGINGYLLGMLVSQCLLTFCNYFAIRRFLPIAFDALQNLWIPGLFLTGVGWLVYRLYQALLPMNLLPPFLLLLSLVSGLLALFLLFLFSSRLVQKNDFRET